MTWLSAFSTKQSQLNNTAMSRLEDSIWTREQMMKWIGQYIQRVSTTEEFSGSEGGIWVSGEDASRYKGAIIYDYWEEWGEGTYELGVLKDWEQQLERRGWYSEWYDAGTVCIWPM